MVWLTSDYFKSLRVPGKSKLVEVYEKIEKRLIGFVEEGDLDFKKCGLILNAYVQNLPMSVYLVKMIEAFILNTEIDDSVDCWELATIAWGFCYLEDCEVENVMNKIRPDIEDRLDEMNLNELLSSLRAYVIVKMESEQMI